MAKSQSKECTIKVRTLVQCVKIPAHRADGTRILNRALLVKVVHVLASFADHATGANARPSRATIAQLVQASPRTITRAFASLQDLGVLRMEKAHSWKLHRPTTWAIAGKVLEHCWKAYMTQVRQRSSAYWQRLRALKRPRFVGSSLSGGQTVHLPSPIQGEKERAEKIGGERTPSPGVRSPLLGILHALQTA